MKRIYFSLLCAVQLFVVTIQAQPPADASEPWENIHLHLNKTTFLQGERMWFTAYVQDQKTQLPSLLTTNLHVGVYDASGESVHQKLVYVEGGMAKGDFAIDSTFTGTDYTVMAWTNYMQNFEHLEPYRQRITVLKDGITEAKDLDESYQIEVYPEGGYLIADAFNRFGIRVVNTAGQAVQLNTLELIDGDGKVVRSNISTNAQGLGLVGINIDQDKVYQIQWVASDGNLVVKETLPKAMAQGVGLNLDNNGEDKVLITLVAAKATFTAKDGQAYSLAIYKDDAILFEEVEIDRKAAVISLERELMPYGVNTAVLFDENLSPVAHRMFFNHRSDNRRKAEIAIEHCLTEFGDSLQLDLMLPKGQQAKAIVSLSALPGQSQAYQPANSLTSAFLVQPYVSSSIDGQYYFEDMDRKKRFELDKRLLVEGWGKYDWDSRKLKEVRTSFEMEQGIRFSGKILDADLEVEQQAYLMTMLTRNMKFMDMASNKSFAGAMPLFQGDSLQLTVIGKRGQLRKPKAELEFEPPETIHSGVLEWLDYEYRLPGFNKVAETVMDQPLNLDQRIIALGEVTVTEKVKKDNKYQISALVEGRIIEDDDIDRYASVRTYLRRLGYLIHVNGFNVTATVPRYPYPIAPIVIDGMVAETGEVINMPLSSVQFITYSKNVDAPFISLSLRPGGYISPERRNKFIRFAVENGYARPQEYFVPDYPNYTSRVYVNYGALDWKSDITVDTEVPTSVTIPLHSQNSIRLYLEGMAASGTLLSEAKHVEFADEPVKSN